MSVFTRSRARADEAGTVYIKGTKVAGEHTPGKLTALLQSELLVDLLAALFLATGLSMATITVTVLEGGFWSCFGLSALSLALILALRPRWWLGPAVAAGSLAVAAGIRAATGALPARLAYWGGFAAWVWRGAPEDTLYSENGSLLLLKAVLVLAVTGAVFLTLRRLFLFPLVLGVVAAAMVTLYAVGRADLSMAVCVSSAGMVILLPRVYARYVEAHSQGKGEKRASMQVVAVPAAVLALLVCLLVTPEDTSSWQSQGLTNFFNDLGYLIGGPFRSAPGSASNFSLSRLGLQPEGDRLGGSVELTDTDMLRVVADRPVLLRGAVMDFYTGERWAVGGNDGDFRHDGLFWRRYRREAFDLDRPLGGREARQLYGELTTELELDIHYLTNRYSTMFSAGGVRSAGFAGGRISEQAYFNMRGELYLHLRIPVGTTLEVETRVWNPRTEEFDTDFLRLEELALAATDDRMEQLPFRYTHLPDSLPQSVRDLAKQIAGNGTPYQQARAIEAYLAEHCTYTLEPGTVPEGADFVAYFLETGEGYCTYYASAMAVLARCVGLPSRYVTGFGLERATGDNTFLATGKTAHAWAEIYFHGIGWMEFDPLSWNPESPLNLYAWVEEPAAAAEPAAPAVGDNAHTPDSPLLGEAATGAALSSGAVVAALAGAVLAVILLRLGLRSLMGRKLRAYELGRVLRRIPGMDQRLDHYYNDILRQLALLDLRARPGETLITFPQRVDRRIRLEEATLAQVAAARMRQRYAELPPTIPEVEAACRYHQSLERSLLERMGRVAYFFRRAISLH